MDLEELGQSLSGRTKTIGREIIFRNSVSSTNTIAIESADKLPEGTVIFAGSQTSGRGRRGRTWLSPPGKNLYMSIILRPDILLRDAPILTLMASVACAFALQRATSLPVSIKWPNDLMISGRKVGGLLSETKPAADRIAYAVIGIGINVNMDIQELPEEIRRVSTSIHHESGEKRSVTEIALEILAETDNWYETLLKTGPAPIIAAWIKLSSTIGMEVKVTMEDSEIRGTAEGIDDAGLLMLRLPDGSVKKISAGDVIHLRNSKG
jgi:BirA family biotin operon repressor/biotin-[acetyl-CoA-carboxylase] ligase